MNIWQLFPRLILDRHRFRNALKKVSTDMKGATNTTFKAKWISNENEAMHL